MAAQMTSAEATKLHMENRRSAIIIFVPNLCRWYGRFSNNNGILRDGRFDYHDIRANGSALECVRS